MRKLKDCEEVSSTGKTRAARWVIAENSNYIYILTKLLSAKTDQEFICLSNFFEQNKKLIDIMAKRFQSDLGCDEKLLEEIRRLASSTGVAEYIESGYSDTVVAVAERPAESSIRSGGPFQRIETPDIYFKDSIEYIYFSDGGKELQAIHYRKLVTRWNEKYSKYIQVYISGYYKACP